MKYSTVKVNAIILKMLEALKKEYGISYVQLINKLITREYFKMTGVNND